MHQSKLEADKCNGREARENVCKRGTIGFGLTSDWLRKTRQFSIPKLLSTLDNLLSGVLFSLPAATKGRLIAGFSIENRSKRLCFYLHLCPVNPSLFCLFWNVILKGSKKACALPYWSLLVVSYTFSDDHLSPFHMGLPSLIRST